MPKISIIIPVYNAQDYLKKCLDSIIEQDLKDIEIICIDDGSHDNSLQILKNYAKQETRLIYKSQTNKGVSAARNLGLQIAKGDYILFVDADDYLADNSLKYLYSCAQNNNLDLLVFGYYHVLGKNISTTAFMDIWKNKFPSTPFKFQFKDSFLLNGSIWNKLISKKVITASKATFPLDISYAEDTIFCFRLYPFIKQIQIMPIAFYYYQNRENNSLSCKNDVFLTLSHLFPEFIKNVPQNNVMAAMDYWCNFYTWNLLKKKKNLSYTDYNIIQDFLKKFEDFDAHECTFLEHYQRLKREICNISCY